MTRTFANRRAAGIVTAALALGVATPAASAMQYNLNSAGSNVPATSVQVQPNAPTTATHDTGGGISDWEYVAIGTGAASLALVGVGATRAATRRHRQRTTPQPRVAA